MLRYSTDPKIVTKKATVVRERKGRILGV